jgi:hypothetical protein
MFADATGTVDPDAGALDLNVELRAMVYQGIGATVPCPTCGGRCLAPEARLDVPCNFNADCDTEEEQGECGRYDATPGDGEREGLCVGGTSAGFGCDSEGVNTTFPAPGGGGTSLDCFPLPAANMAGQGLIVNLNETTGTASLGTGVPCGFTLPGAERLCPCGQCSDGAAPCASNVDCTAPATCATDSGTAFPTECDDEVCTIDATGEGVCADGPIDRFCDQILRSNGRGLLGCNSNADCAAEVVGTPGACTLEEARECFPTIISAVGKPDPRTPVAVAVSCIASTSSSALNDSIGLPGAMRMISQLALTGRCEPGSPLPYVPGQGCP